MSYAQESLISELETAVKGGTSERRLDTLRRVTDLFLIDADRFSEEQIQVFDDVLCLLIDRVETKAKAELSARLAPVDHAPHEVVRTLAHDDAIDVAGPVLANSKQLSDSDLIEIARTKSQGHLLAISSREVVGEGVTDVLLDRGDRQVVHKLAGNSGAKFSEVGYRTLVRKADGDETLASLVGMRLDLPIKFFRELLLRATEAVRSRLLATAPPEAQDEIRRVLEQIARAAPEEPQRSYTQAEQYVIQMHERGLLNESVLYNFAVRRSHEEMTAALALLAGAPIDMIARLVQGLRTDTLLIPCKAAGLAWPTVEAILRNRHAGHTVSEQVVALAKGDYAKLTRETAARTMRFGQARRAAGASDERGAA